MKETLKIKLQRVIYIIIAWLAIGQIMAVFEYFSAAANMPNGTDFCFSIVSLSYFIGSLMGGFLIAPLFVFVFYGYLRKRSFIKGQLILLFLSIFLISFSAIAGSLIFNMVDLKKGPLSSEVIIGVYSYILEGQLVKLNIAWVMIMLLTYSFFEVMDRYGHGMLWQSLSGKFHKPYEEERVFMFLDLNDSTNLAEKMGHLQFGYFIRDFFADLTDPLLNRKGQIYQYVGDEVIVSWSCEDALFNDNAVELFFDFLDRLEARRSYYEKSYSIFPTFKAGVHVGTVLVAEVGEVKRDISYMGDVMNTTARLLDLSKEYHEPLVITGALKEKGIPSRRNTISLGDAELRGKDQRIPVLAVAQSC